jgi:glycosyltransferase involved in cell wall biosynthesis
MRVLHMPVNTASIASTTVRALHQHGVDAYGIVFATNVVQSYDGLRPIIMGNKRQPHKALWGIVRFGLSLADYLRRGKPDLVHWYYSGSASTLDMDIRLLKTLNVPGLVEWTGSDIRIPEVEFTENPYYAAAFNNGYEYRRFENKADSLARQRRFAQIGFAAAAATGMMQYVQPDIFPQVFRLEQRLILSDFEPIFPRHDQKRPLIVHSPTAKVTKGTQAVLDAIEKLKPRLDFDFRLITGMPRQEALSLVQQSDIFLDQFVLGDRGFAALEAMAFGKPVVCYLKPSLVQAYPRELPIVNASQDALADALECLIRDSSLRRELGQQSRAYVEQYHDAAALMPHLIDIYRSLTRA